MSAEMNLELALRAMTDPTSRALYDVTIVCTTDEFQASYWMTKLSDGICQKQSNDSLFPMVLAVNEDWEEGGAGNGTGTLYAYQKAIRMAKDKYDVDVANLLRNKEISVALYHTAGKGTRLAPLPASENNNKPGVVRIYGSWLIIVMMCSVIVDLLCFSFHDRNYPFAIRHGMDPIHVLLS
jgi:hypothetical protein